MLRREKENSRSVGLVWNGWKLWPPDQLVLATRFRRPPGPNALSHAVGLYCSLGRTRESRYALVGEINVEVIELRRDVHCFRANLSEHDLESVSGLSARAMAVSVTSAQHVVATRTWLSSHYPQLRETLTSF